jgi:hypothetical protein
MAKHNRVQLIRVADHEGRVGNEMAYQLARTRSEHLFTGPEPACCISVGEAMKAVRYWTNRNHIKHWESITGLRQANGLTAGSSAKNNEGSIKIKQRPVKMGGRTLYRTMSPKRTRFQKDDPTCKQ